MANGGNGGNGNGYDDFTTWTKQDLADTLAQVSGILTDVYQPESSREDLAGAVGDALNTISGDDDDDEDDNEDEDSDDGN
jgi:hypothetical protein